MLVSACCVRREGAIPKFGFIKSIKAILYPFKLLDVLAQVICVVVLRVEFVFQLMEYLMNRVLLIFGPSYKVWLLVH